MPVLTIIRGAPGSGKSTLASILAEANRADHIEADMYFIDDDGEYRFVPSRIKAAHNWCRCHAARYMSIGGPVIVSNTFTQRWEMEPYIHLAEQYGYTVQIIECKANFGNIHGVPDDVVRKMKNRWEVVDVPDSVR